MLELKLDKTFAQVVLKHFWHEILVYYHSSKESILFDQERQQIIHQIQKKLDCDGIKLHLSLMALKHFKNDTKLYSSLQMYLASSICADMYELILDHQFVLCCSGPFSGLFIVTGQHRSKDNILRIESNLAENHVDVLKSLQSCIDDHVRQLNIYI